MKKYIDAEGVMRVCYDSFLKTGNRAFYEIFALVEAVPAEEVQEIRQGKWMNDGHTLACSNCHTINIRGVAYDYCPHCGAHMIEEETK